MKGYIILRLMFKKVTSKYYIYFPNFLYFYLKEK
jgi:hypothetical protein